MWANSPPLLSDVSQCLAVSPAVHWHVSCQLSAVSCQVVVWLSGGRLACHTHTNSQLPQQNINPRKTLSGIKRTNLSMGKSHGRSK